MTSPFHSFNFESSRPSNTKLYICSDDRDADESEVNFSVEFRGAQLDQIKSLAVHTANIPNMLKNIEAGSNTISMELSDATPVIFTIEPGFYTVLELGVAVIDGYNAILGAAPELINFAYDSVTGLATFDRPVGPRTFKFNVSSPLEFANQDIARDKLKMPNVLDSTQVSLSPVNLFPRVKQMFISVDVVFGNFDTTSAGQQNYVIGIPVVTQFGTILSYKDEGDTNMHINFPVTQNIGFARIRLTDKDNQEIRDLVGFAWDLTLVADTFELR